MVNPDHVLSTIWAEINSLPEFAGFKSISKGAKRPGRRANPAATIHLLTAPIDGETDAMRCTVTVNCYLDDLKNGEMDSVGLGRCANALLRHFHKNHSITHPELDFKSILVLEPLIGLPGEFEKEHFASVKIRMIVKSKGGN